MAYQKDYKTLYEATKLDLKDQVTYSVDLETDIEDLKKELREYKDNIQLRERVATEVHRQGWDTSMADKMLAWIGGDKPAKVPSVISHGMAGTTLFRKANTKKKRKYTKKAKFWNKKKK